MKFATTHLLPGALLLLAGCPGLEEATNSTDTADTTDGAATAGASADPTAPTTSTGEPTTGAPTTGEPTTGEPTTGGAVDVGAARLLYMPEGPANCAASGLRRIDVADGVASPPTTLLAAPEGGALDCTPRIDAGQRWLTITDAGHERLWIVDLASLTLEEVVLPPGVDRVGMPDFSDDGSRIAFTAGPQGGPLDLYVCTLEDGGGCAAEPVNAPLPAMASFDGGGVFSPDHTRLVYAVRPAGGGAQLLLVDLAAPGVTTTLASHPGEWTNYGLRRFSPDSQTLYFSVDVEADKAYDYFALDVGAGLPGDPVPMLPKATGPGTVRFSPDQSALVWWDGAMMSGDLYRVAVSGTTVGPPQLLNTSGPGHVVFKRFEWTADGQRLASLSDQDAAGVDELYIVDADGGPPNPVKLSAPIAAGGRVSSLHLTPSPDRLLYFASPGDKLGTAAFLARIDAPGDVVELSAPLPPGGWLNEGHAWTSDGARMMYTGQQEVVGVVELFLVDEVDALPKPPVKLNGPLPPDGHVGFEWHFASDGQRVFFTADAVGGEDTLYTVAIGPDGQPAPPVELSEPGERVEWALVLPPA